MTPSPTDPPTPLAPCQSAPGIVRPARRPAGWQPGGPGSDWARVLRERPELGPGPYEDLCFLSGDWRILQRTDGHRWSLDDLVTAWVARRGPAPARALDLGCGIGSVLMMVAWSFERARCVGVEAQAVSVALAQRSIALNGVGDRVRVVHADLRSAEADATLDDEGPFDLVTGTPPYFADGAAVMSDAVQRGPCRFELRGGVEDYVSRAARYVASGGRIVVCAAAGQRERVEAAAAAARRAVWRLDVVPREGKPPLLSVFELTEGAASTAEAPLVVRGLDGQWTAAFRAIRDHMGMPTRR